MVPCLIVTHGQLASELVAAAEMIVGEIEHIIPLCIGWQEDVNDAHDELGRAIANLNKNDGLIILTDMFGGTPSNLAISFLEKGKVEVITGVNLPMIIKAATQAKDENLETLVNKIVEKGKSNITIASNFLNESTE